MAWTCIAPGANIKWLIDIYWLGMLGIYTTEQITILAREHAYSIFAEVPIHKGISI